MELNIVRGSLLYNQETVEAKITGYNEVAIRCFNKNFTEQS